MTFAPASLHRTLRRASNRTLRMSEREYVAWAMKQELVRSEWVDGRVTRMAPVSLEHSDLVGWLLSVTRMFVEEHDLGRVHGSEFMARFAKVPSRRVPDVLFISKSRLNLLQPNHFEGAPDLIMEVVSPDSESRDWREKFKEYEQGGVREYWVIDPNSQHVEVYSLGRGKRYRPIAEKNGALRSGVVRGFWIKTAWLWPDTRPSLLAAAKALGLRM